jgi:hypothetical protein
VSLASEQNAREILAHVWGLLFETPPTQAELQLVQAVSKGEGGYGLATYQLLQVEPGEGYGTVIGTTSQTNNWGAVQAGEAVNGVCDPATSFMATDSSPNRKTAENPKGLYYACFRRYATPELGCESFLKTLLIGSKTFPRGSVRDAVASGSADEVARAMYETHYYEGFGATAEERIGHYADAIAKNAASIASALGEPLLVTRGEGLLGGGGGLGFFGACVGIGGLYLLWKGLR